MNKFYQRLVRLCMVLASVIIVAGASSCNSDKCDSVTCGNNGTCKEGACVCPAGYEGPSCELQVRTKFLGIYTVHETGTVLRNPTADYSLTIEETGNRTVVQIRNLRNTFVETVKANIAGDSMTIPLQTVDGHYQVQGNGRIDINSLKYYAEHATLNVRYIVRDTDRPTQQPDDYGYDIGTPSQWSR